jgi:hypothetical protein
MFLSSFTLEKFFFLNLILIEKIDSIDCVAPNKKYSTKVVKSLFDWAELILCRENSYVENIAKSFENKKRKTFLNNIK